MAKSISYTDIFAQTIKLNGEIIPLVIAFGQFKLKPKIPVFKSRLLSPLQIQMVQEKELCVLLPSYKKLKLINLKKLLPRQRT